jgi:hypothetical protein
MLSIARRASRRTWGAMGSLRKEVAPQAWPSLCCLATRCMYACCIYASGGAGCRSRGPFCFRDFDCHLPGQSPTQQQTRLVPWSCTRRGRKRDSGGWGVGRLGLAGPAHSRHRAGARVREAALPHRFSAAHTLAWPSRVFSFSLKHSRRWQRCCTEEPSGDRQHKPPGPVLRHRDTRTRHTAELCAESRAVRTSHAGFRGRSTRHEEASAEAGYTLRGPCTRVRARRAARRRARSRWRRPTPPPAGADGDAPGPPSRTGRVGVGACAAATARACSVRPCSWAAARPSSCGSLADPAAAPAAPAAPAAALSAAALAAARAQPQTAPPAARCGTCMACSHVAQRLAR